MRWAILAGAVLGALALLLIVRTCQPPVVRDFRIPASDRVVTVDVAGRPAASSAPTVAKLAVSPGRGVIHVNGNATPVTVRQLSPAVRISSKAPGGKMTTISETPAGEVETATVAEGGGTVVTSQPEPITLTIKAPEPSPVGVIFGVLPGWVALDVALIRGRPLAGLGIDTSVSLDVAGNAQMIGAGMAVGDKVFATGGGCVEWGGRMGGYVAAGVRF